MRLATRIAAFGGIMSAATVLLSLGGDAAPTSGPLARLGLESENGARMVVDELNAKDFSYRQGRRVLLGFVRGGALS